MRRLTRRDSPFILLSDIKLHKVGETFTITFLAKTHSRIACKPTLILVMAVTVLCLACSKQKQAGQGLDADKYKDWMTYSYENVKIIYPPSHPLANNLETMAKGYTKATRQICRFLKINEPSDTLVIYFYTGFGQGREMTGREYPFADGSAIHFWLPSFYGPTLMQYLIPQWQDAEPKYPFLKHGLIALFDYSGQNYYQSTQGYRDENNFISLPELAVDTTVNSNTERHQSAEAATFVDFIVYHFGIEDLNRLYTAKAPFEEAVPEIFKMPVDSLEGLWLDFVKQQVDAIDTTKAE
jgi:hypothetical protein